MEAFSIEWKGQTLSVSEDQAFELGEAIENIIPFTDLHLLTVAPNFHKIARCYSTMINHAGGKSTPTEVYGMIMSEISSQIEAGGQQVEELMAVKAVATLIAILTNGMPEAKGDGGKK